MNSEFRTTRMVEFFETDMAGIMHFSNFFRFMESAEHAFFRSKGFSVDEAKALGLGWPRVKAECEYRHPLRFEDVVEINVKVRRLGTRSITMEFQFSKTEDGHEISVATGAITAVCVERDSKTGGFRRCQSRKKSAPDFKPMQTSDDSDLVGRLRGAAAYRTARHERSRQWPI